MTAGAGGLSPLFDDAEEKAIWEQAEQGAHPVSRQGSAPPAAALAARVARDAASAAVAAAADAAIDVAVAAGEADASASVGSGDGGGSGSSGGGGIRVRAAALQALPEGDEGNGPELLPGHQAGLSPYYPDT